METCRQENTEQIHSNTNIRPETDSWSKGESSGSINEQLDTEKIEEHGNNNTIHPEQHHLNNQIQ